MNVAIGPKAEKFATGVGKLLVALLFLEHALRLYLDGLRPVRQVIELRRLAELKASDVLPETALTDSATYQDLIARYNQAVRKESPDCDVDEGLGELHHTIATGRMSPLISPDTPFALLTFGRPSGGQVEVTAVQLLSEEWLEARFAQIMAATEKVQAAFRARVKS